MITVTKKDLIALGYGTSFSADIIRKAKKLMIEKGHTYYQSRKLDRVPKEAVEECSCTVEKHKTWIASPATIPKSGERNRKIHSCVLYLISI